MSASLAVALALSLWPFGHHGAPAVAAKTHHRSGAAVTLVRQRVGRWSVRAVTDRFTGEVECRVWRGDVAFSRGALELRTPRGKVTEATAYVVDDGPVFRAQDDRLALVRLGFTSWGDDLADPTASVLRIPGERAAGGRIVRVQLKRDHRPLTYRIDGLAEARAAAGRDGCAGMAPQPQA